MKKSLVFAALCLAAISSFAHAAPVEVIALAKPVAYQTLAIGTRSGCDVAAKMVISSESEWQRVWQKHSVGDEFKMSAPPVDWSSKAVVVLLGGQSSGSLEVARVERTAAATTIYYAVAKNNGGAAQPFHFALINAAQGEVRFVDSAICAVCAPIRYK